MKQNAVKQSQFVSTKQPVMHRMRILLLILLMVCTALPAAALAQEAAPTVIDPAANPDVTILSQTQTPDAIQTTIRINVSKDSFLSSLNPNTNYGTNNQLRMGWSEGIFNAMRILIEFDISAIPRNAIINNATLNIFQRGVTPGNDRPMDYRAQFMRNGWDENGVTWNNANNLGGDSLPLGSVSSNTGWQTTDVSNIVGIWHSGTRPNNGVIVTGDEIPANNRMRQFDSREQGSNAPFVVVDFTVNCDTIAPNASVNGLPTFSPGQFSVSWSGTDSAPSGCTPSGIANFDVEYRINNSSWHAWRNQTTGTTNGFNNWANNGDTVQFRARATDRAGNVQAFGNPQTSTRIDTQPPVVTVTPLPATTTSPFFTLSWSGTDNLSGVANYDVQWRENGGSWQMLLEQTRQTSFQITGAQNGFTYDFRVRATDNVGNSAEWPDNPQTSTRVNTTSHATVLAFVPNMLKPTAPVTTSFGVNWTVNAATPGAVASVDIFYQFNGGQWVRWQVFPATQTSATFDFTALGLGDGLYGFEAVAINTNGQREPQSFTPEATMLVDIANNIQPHMFLSKIYNLLENSVAQAEASPQE